MVFASLASGGREVALADAPVILGLIGSDDSFQSVTAMSLASCIIALISGVLAAHASHSPLRVYFHDDPSLK